MQELPVGLLVKGGRYHIRVQVAGQRTQQSTGLKATAPNLQRAVKKLHQIQAQLESGDSPRKRKSRPFSDGIAIYLDWVKGEHKESTAERIRVSTVSLCAFFLRAQTHQITAGNLEDFKSWRRSNAIKEVTIRHDMHALSGYMQFAVKQGWTKRNVTEDVTIPSDKEAVRQHALSIDEEMRYFAAAAKWPILHDVGRLMILQGLRPTEALSIRRGEYDPRSGSLAIVKGKTKAAKRTLKLLPESCGILSRRLAVNEMAFKGKRGGKPTLQKNHLKACEKACVSFVPYDLRHSFATRMAERGCPIPTLAAIMGHANLRTISRYVHVGQDAQSDAMLKYGGSPLSNVAAETILRA